MKTILITLFLSYAIANAATVNIPLDANIQAAVDANPAGTIFQLAAGVYHMQTVTAKDGDQFIGALDGAGNRLTILSGAQPLTSFTRDAFGNYVAATSQTQPGQQVGYCSPGYSRCTFPEDFFYDNEPYVHNSVGAEALAQGQYYFDYPNGRICFRPKNSADDPNGHKVEYSRIRSAISGSASHVTVRNLIVEKYAVPLQFGAIGDQYPGDGWVLQNNETRFNHGLGLRVPTNGQVLGNYTHDNGQMGMGGSGANILVQDNEIARNNYIGVDHNFECGGFKFAGTDGLTVRNNYSHDNVGPGMWTDISSIRTLYENNVVMNNTRAGIFYETSYDAVIRNNTILNNGSFAPDDWLWNAQLQIAASQNVEAYGNVILVNSENNGNGIMLIQQNRSSEPCIFGPCRVANNYIHDNIIIVTGTRSHGSSGGVQDFSGLGDLYAPSSNNRFTGNHYYVTDLNSAAYWQWANRYQTFDAFKLFGLDATGTVNLSSTPGK
jgi:parallel beta-helix repeat protein